MQGTKVHLGCWHRFIPGFIHVDLCDMPHIDHVSSIDKLPFLNDNSAELIYCSHALEYFDRDDAKLVLREWLRVLRPGGVLRLAVPNLSALIKIYESTADISKILGPLYGKMHIDGIDGDETLYHKTVYDEASLKSLFLECGFSEPCLWDWRLTEHSIYDDHSQAYFPHMQKESGVHVSLNMQAKKP